VSLGTNSALGDKTPSVLHATYAKRLQSERTRDIGAVKWKTNTHKHPTTTRQG